MSVTLKLNFSKIDSCNNNIFVVTKEDGFSYAKLIGMYDKLRPIYDTFLPLYGDKEKNFATIRFRPDTKYQKFHSRSLYEITFSVHSTDKNGVKYVNCYIKNARLISKGKPIDRGEVLTFA
jgi:hypothetical protein